MKKQNGVWLVVAAVFAVLISGHMVLELLIGYVFRELTPPIIIYVLLMAATLSIALFSASGKSERIESVIERTGALLLAIMVVHVLFMIVTQAEHQHSEIFLCSFCGRMTTANYILPLAIVGVLLCLIRIRNASPADRILPAVDLIMLGALTCHLLVLLVSCLVKADMDGYTNDCYIVFYYFPVIVTVNVTAWFVKQVRETIE